MKLDIETLKNSFEVGYNTYKASYAELEVVENLYHNYQYTPDQLNVLENRGSPKETFNVIKMFDRAMQGYFSTVINTITVNALEDGEVANAERINRTLDYILRLNDFEMKKEDILLHSLHSGIVCTYIDVVKLQQQDDVGRDLVDLDITIVNPKHLVLDPKSVEYDYSDARFLHTYKWLDEPTVKALFGTKKTNDLVEYGNHLNTVESEYTNIFGNGGFEGKYILDNEYLIVNTMIKDDKGKWYMISWCGDKVLAKEEVKYEKALPYRVVKLHRTNTPEFYGIYREIIETQHAINQALIQIQQLVNTKKVLVQDGAVQPDEWEDFKEQVVRVNGVLKVNMLDGIKIENVSADIVQQYNILENAIKRIQQILHINDSFLGQANASDSGRKVNMQKTSSIVALRYVVTRLEFLYKMLGLDIIHLVKQYFNATQTIPTQNNYGEQEFDKVNVPLTDPDTGEVAKDYKKNDKGEYEAEIINDPDTELDFNRMDIMVSAANFDDSADADKLMLEQTIQGPVGAFLQQADPVSFLQVAALITKQKRTKHSSDVAEIINKVAQKLGGAQIADPRAMEQQQAQGGATGSPMDVASTMGLSNEIKHPTER